MTILGFIEAYCGEDKAKAKKVKQAFTHSQLTDNCTTHNNDVLLAEQFGITWEDVQDFATQKRK